MSERVERKSGPFAGNTGDFDPRENMDSSLSRREQRRAAFQELRDEIRSRLMANGSADPTDERIDKILIKDPRFIKLMDEI